MNRMFMNTKLHSLITAPLVTGIALLWASSASAHAFPEETRPEVGAVLNKAPQQVWIRFDSRLEDEFSVIVVKNAAGNRVSGKTKLDPESRRSLEVGLKALAPGDYHVYWSVVSWDGHRSKGDYVFHINPK